MRLIRNFLRKSWLIYYLMGASPTLHSSFIRQAPPNFLQNMSKETLYGPYATSLRLSPLGYHSLVQDHLNISYNSLEKYVQQLKIATETVQPHYKKILAQYGKDEQLNANTLQIEAEYYASIRPKQTVKRCERPTTALTERGIQYIEVRCIDINPYEPLGINTTQIHFLEVFLVYCLLESSPVFQENSPQTYRENQAKVAERGRYPIIELLNENRSRSEIAQVAKHIFIDLNKVAALLDQHQHHKHYHDAVMNFAQQLMDPQTLLSERLLNETQRRGDFIPFMQELATKHHAFYNEHPLSPEVLAQYKSLASESINNQHSIEAADNKSYEEYVEAYFKGTPNH
jgi:glutamate--cysteine ligase